MKYLSQEKIDVVNQLTAIICNEVCEAVSCSDCPLRYLKVGIDMAIEDKKSIDQIKKYIKNRHSIAINANDRKYDGADRYKFNIEQRGDL